MSDIQYTGNSTPVILPDFQNKQSVCQERKDTFHLVAQSITPFIQQKESQLLKKAVTLHFTDMVLFFDSVKLSPDSIFPHVILALKQ